MKPLSDHPYCMRRLASLPAFLNPVTCHSTCWYTCYMPDVCEVLVGCSAENTQEAGPAATEFSRLPDVRMGTDLVVWDCVTVEL